MALFPRSVALGLTALAFACLCSAQTPVSFTGVSSVSGQSPGNIYAVDLNNDGLTDILQDTGLGSPGFTVSLNNGNGTFKAPVLYGDASPSAIGTQPLATADFNNDGKVDVAVILTRTNQIAVYLGNGDGTFQSPITSTTGLPAGWVFAAGGAAVGDFNADGKEDIVAWTEQIGANNSSGPTGLYAFQGDGTGKFLNAANLVLAGPTGQPNFLVFVGDYDSDGKADIAAAPYTQDSNGNTANTTVHVLYGDNNFTFTDTTPYSYNGPLWIGSGDLNSDGFTDLYGLQGGFSLMQQLAVLYGNSSRTFSNYFMNLPNTYQTGATGATADNYISQFTIGDFNGDGRMDLAAFAEDTTFTHGYVEFLLATTSPGQFTPQFVALPTTYLDQTQPIAGLFSSSRLKPDVALNQSPNTGSPPQNTPSYNLAELNQASTGWFGPCYYPETGQGFNVCNAGTVSGSTATFNAAASSFGQLRKIELWVDGKKVSEQYHAWDHHGYFNYSATFAVGTHSATFFAGDVDNRLQRYDFTFTVGGAACAAPSSPGVNICSPANNSTVSSPVTVVAAANITGTLARMELWIDGVKFYTETSSTSLSVSYPLASGKHQFGVYAVNTAGAKWLGLVYATVP